MSYLLVVEDSKIDRDNIILALSAAAVGVEIRCVEDPFLAREMIAKEDPLLIILDVELPRMSGGEFLGHLMRHHPLPVVVVTRECDSDCERIEKLHLLGVVQVLYKPKSINEQSRFTHQLQQVFDTIVSVHSADRECYSESDVDRVDYNACQVGQSTFAAAPLAIALGASTGGPVAISEVVRHFNSNSPPILIAQHISSRFSKTMVQGLQRLTDMKVTIAKPGTQITRGRVYIAPPEHHMEVDAGGRVKILNTVAADKFAPSVNLLFNSLSRSRLTSVIAVLMTGMGDDGAEGLLRLRKVGATTIAEHQSTCVVYGMPARAVEIGAALEVLPLPAIGPRILEHVAEFNAKKNRNRNLRLRFARTNSMD